MTEAEWSASNDPAKMLACVTPDCDCAVRQISGSPVDRSKPHLLGCRHVGDRKLRLFAAACCRAVWSLLTDDAPCGRCEATGMVYCNTRDKDWGRQTRGGFPIKRCDYCNGSGRVNRSRRAVEVAERFCDTEMEAEDWSKLNAAGEAADDARRGSPHCPWNQQEPDQNKDMAALAVCNLRQPAALTAVLEASRLCGNFAAQTALLREIAGNPFRPATLPHSASCPSWAGPKTRTECGCQCDWHTPTVLTLARAAYEERLGRVCKKCGGDGEPSEGDDWERENGECHHCHGTGRIDDGSLDPQRLAVLADALEEAGCTSEELLRHLRGEEPVLCVMAPAYRLAGWRPLRGPHVRGCWALDLLLGKS